MVNAFKPALKRDQTAQTRSRKISPIAEAEFNEKTLKVIAKEAANLKKHPVAGFTKAELEKFVGQFKF